MSRAGSQRMVLGLTLYILASHCVPNLNSKNGARYNRALSPFTPFCED